MVLAWVSIFRSCWKLGIAARSARGVRSYGLILLGVVAISEVGVLFKTKKCSFTQMQHRFCAPVNKSTFSSQTRMSVL